MNTCACIPSAVGPSSTIRSFLVGGPSGKSVPVYRTQPLDIWTLNVPSADSARADHCRIRRMAIAPRTTATAAIAPRRHLAAPAGVDRAVAAAVAVGVVAGWDATAAASGFTAADVLGAVPGTSGAPHRGHSVAPLPCQVQHFRQTERLIWPTSRSQSCSSA